MWQDRVLKSWKELSRVCGRVLAPMWSRPTEQQVGALCFRRGKDGVEILLITSRDTGRWIPPKGWPMAEQSAPEVARIEAWEEAGVRPKSVSREPVGYFHYQKALEDGARVPCRVALYAVEVASLAKKYPEMDDRNRNWFKQAEAARLVGDPGLDRLIAGFRPASEV